MLTRDSCSSSRHEQSLHGEKGAGGGCVGAKGLKMRQDYHYTIKTVLRVIIPLLALITALLGFAGGNFSQAFLGSAISLLSIGAEIVNRNISKLEEERRHILPQLDADLVRNGNIFNLVVRPKNETPFKYRYKIETKERLRVSGLLLGDFECYPDQAKTPNITNAIVDLRRVKDNYIELHVSFWSIYQTMLPRESLGGWIVVPYSTRDGGLVEAQLSRETRERIATEGYKF
jgi:hypothetical protein